MMKEEIQVRETEGKRKRPENSGLFEKND